MIDITTRNVIGFEEAVSSARNFWNDWSYSDSFMDDDNFVIGDDDLQLLKKLNMGSPSHSKYRRMINVYADILAPLYWWKEYDTYKVGTVTNSCSTMHTITNKEFEMKDFSTEHLKIEDYAIGMDGKLQKEKFNLWNQTIKDVIDALNIAIMFYNSAESEDLKKQYWWTIIQLLPSSYNQKRTVMLNYEVLANIYKTRCLHKLDEWRHFCKWIKSLPYSELIIAF